LFAFPQSRPVAPQALGVQAGAWYDPKMKTTWRFLKRHGRRLVVVGIAGVVFVFLIGFFGRLVG
jgi:hypothetical protein